MEMIFGKELATNEEKNRELGADIKAKQTIRRDADAIVLRLVDQQSIVSSRSAHSIPLSRSPEYSYRVISSEHPSKVARSLVRAPRVHRNTKSTGIRYSYTHSHACI